MRSPRTLLQFTSAPAGAPASILPALREARPAHPALTMAFMAGSSAEWQTAPSPTTKRGWSFVAEGLSRPRALPRLCGDAAGAPNRPRGWPGRRCRGGVARVGTARGRNLSVPLSGGEPRVARQALNGVVLRQPERFLCPGQSASAARRRGPGKGQGMTYPRESVSLPVGRHAALASLAAAKWSDRLAEVCCGGAPASS
jgi:hypothetical protein